MATWGANATIPGLSIWTEELDAHDAAPDPRDPSVMQQAQMDTPTKLERLLASGGYAHIRVTPRTFEYQWTVDRIVGVQLACGWRHAD